MSVATGSNLPRLVAGYRIERELTTGATGIILLGRRERERVAIKLIDRTGKDVIAHARNVATIAHPNLTRVLAVERHEAALAIVLEHLEGQTVAMLIERLRSREKTLPFELAAYIIAEACSALDALHDRGLLHERLTPHDIFITYDGRVKLLDVAVPRDGDASTLAPRELPYTSPESCKGDPLDWRSDVFSLGAILWELMTGVAAFAHPAEADTIRAIISGEPHVPPGKIMGVLPTAVSEIALKALAADPAKRYISARALRLPLIEFAGKGDHRPALERTMHAAFSDVLPKAEPAHVIDSPPPIEAAPVAAAVAESEPPVALPKKGSVGIVSVLAAVLLLGAGAFALRQRGAPVAPVATAVAPQAPIAAAAASREIPAPPAPPETTRVQVETVPPGATISVGGVMLGTSPADLKLPKGTTPIDLEIQRPGYQLLRERLVPDVDQRLRLTLVPAKTQRAPAAAPTAGNPYHRFD